VVGGDKASPKGPVNKRALFKMDNPLHKSTNDIELEN